jgi:sugar phosphate isomerase/epimerase
MKDEHLWPGDGTIDWPVAVKYLKELHTPPATVLEISQNLPDTMTEIEDRIAKGFALFD